MPRILVLGAGISGLATTWYLKEKFGSSVSLLCVEASHRPGGWIRTTYPEGFLCEHGPRGFRPQGKGRATHALCHALGITSQLIPANPTCKRRYLYVKGSLRSLNPWFLLQHGLLSSLFQEIRTPKGGTEDQTVAAFFSRRLGPSLTQLLIAPLVTGIFGGDFQTLSIQACFPTLWQYEQKWGGLLKGWWQERHNRAPRENLPPLFSFREGMETLPRALAEALAPYLQLHTPVQGLTFQGEKAYVTLPEGIQEVDAVFSTLPLPTLLALWPACPFGLSMPYNTLSLVHLGWEGEYLPYRGYGCLVPPGEGKDILGMTWDSEIFPAQNRGKQTRLCLLFPEDKAKTAPIPHLLEKMVGITEPPSLMKTEILSHAIPQYLVGHTQRRQTLLAQLPPALHLVGNAYTGVGINDCITQARDAVKGFSV